MDLHNNLTIVNICRVGRLGLCHQTYIKDCKALSNKTCEFAESISNLLILCITNPHEREGFAQRSI